MAPVDPARQARAFTLGLALFLTVTAPASAYVAVDLTPAGFGDSTAAGAAVGQQVGTGFEPGLGGGDHALLWSGTAASVIDLNPAGFDRSQAWGGPGA
jgi:hypothetical protein